MTGSVQLTQSERLKRFVSSEDHFDADSFEIAKFSKPVIEVPFARVRYEQFRNNLLEEMVAIRADLEKSADETARKEAQMWLQYPNLSEKRAAKARVILESEDVFDACPDLYDVWDRIEQLLMKTALQLEAERTKPFEHLIEFVESILIADTNLAAAEYPQPSEGLVEMGDEQLRRFLNVSQAVHTVNQIIAVEEMHSNSMGSEVEELTKGAVQSKDTVDLWEALAWFRENMVNRNECIRLMSREAESIMHLLLEMALIEQFLTIRKELSIQE